MVLYTPKWSRGIPSEWIAGLEETIAQPDSKNTIGFGCSFGVDVAINPTTCNAFRKVIARALPPFFEAELA